MATRKPTPASTVDAFVAGLAQPLRREVDALRKVIRSAVPEAGEAIKWNAPSYFTGEHFATMRVGGKVLLQLILHLGAKKQALSRDAIDDPAGLLQWRGADRACVDFAEAGAVDAKAPALRAILRQWVRHVPLTDPIEMQAKKEGPISRGC